MRRKSNPFNSVGAGVLTGFLLPVMVFFVVYLFDENDISFSQYLNGLWHLQALFKLISLCVFTNLLLFMGFIRLKFDRAAQGVLGATILYALLMVISKAF